MSAVLRLLALIIRRAPRQAAGAAALCAAGVAVAVLVASTVIAAYVGLGARGERVAWREPTRAPIDQATGVQQRSLELFSGERIDRIDLAAVTTGPEAAARVPVPPGLSEVPAPGTAFVSPALARLIGANEPAELGDRFGTVVGIIGEAGLARPDELVAVVGRAPGDLEIDDAVDRPDEAWRFTGAPSPVTPVDSFDLARVDRDLEMYRYMALVAVVLVSVPALMLVGSAARLTAARRSSRLAVLRLAGATPGAVRALAAADTALGAVTGAVVGVIASLLVAPSLRGVELAGGGWYADDLRLGAGPALGLVVGASLVSVAAAVASLRRVTTGPLGVVRSVEAQRARWPRILGVALSFPALFVASLAAADGGSITGMILVLGLVIASLGLVGPWVCSLMGRLTAALARTPSTLIAGRRIVDDPKAAYRVIGSVVLAGLIAGFLAGVLPTVDANADERDSFGSMSMTTTAATAEQMELASDRLGGLPGGTEISTEGELSIDDGQSLAEVMITLGPDVSMDEVRTATTSFREGNPLPLPSDDVFGDITLVGDVRRASLVILLAGLVLGAASSAVAAAAAVVDQRRTIGRLALIGFPVAMLQRARRWQSTVPLVVATAGAVALGVGSAVSLMIGFGVAPERIVGPSSVSLALTVVAALVIGLASSAVTRPLLVSASRSGPHTTPD